MRVTAVKVLVVAAAILSGATVLSQASPQQVQWEKSGHNNVKSTMLESTVEQRQATAAHCGRCHSEQGYLAWLPQQQKGVPGNILGPDGKAATVEYLSSIGLNKAQVRPVTCATCHDAKGGMRVNNETGMLPSGFNAVGVGKGATCITCHNTRNGRINWSNENPGRYTAPHEAAQGDVLMGKNFYFVNDTGETASPHATSTGDSCVTCHKTNNAKDQHSFVVNSQTLCSTCHGLRYKGEQVQNPTHYLLEKLKGVIFAQIKKQGASIVSVAPFDEVTHAPGKPVPFKIADMVAIDEIRSDGGQMSIEFETAAGDTWTARIADFRVGPAATDASAIPTTSNIVRGIWNYLMVEYDGSMGVHNPSMVRSVLNATIDALSK
jgi:hypothetical protein